jgi:hypothetical protein
MKKKSFMSFYFVFVALTKKARLVVLGDQLYPGLTFLFNCIQVNSCCSSPNCKSCWSSNVEQVKKRKFKSGATTKIVVDDVVSEKTTNCAGFNHPKRPLRRGSFRSSSFGGVGNRRGSAPVDVVKADGIQVSMLKFFFLGTDAPLK